MTRVASATLLLVWWFLSGCSSLTVPTPLGERVSGENAPSLNGVWQMQGGEDGVLHAHHIAEHHLRVAGLEWDEDAVAYKTVQRDILVGAAADGWLFFNLPQAQWGDDEIDTPSGPIDGPYVPMLVELINDDGTPVLKLYDPNYEAWAVAVEQDQLAGSAERHDNNVIEVVVSADAEALEAFLGARELDTLFDLDEGGELRRIVVE